ncbi:MAG: response regulator [Elusimicrobiota bacterium]
MAKKILVIDDEPAIAQLIKINLTEEGYEVETALSGTEGIEKVKSFKPDIITLDVMMPEMNGFQVMELLKKDPKTKDTPVIFISIVEGPQKEKGFHLGAVDFLSKPIEFGELFKSIKNIESANPPEDRLPQKEILIIDDEKDTANLIKIHLDEEGYKTFVAYNGPDGVALARERKPELVILDLYMPGMDGFAVLKILKQDKETEHIPIVILTGHDTKGYREKCLMLGASEYFTKSFSEKEMVKEIKKMIS